MDFGYISLFFCDSVHGIQRFLLQRCLVRDIFLPLFQHLWLKGRLSVLRNLNIYAAIAAVNALGFATVTISVPNFYPPGVHPSPSLSFL